MPTATATVTPMPESPTLSVSVATNCCAGPGAAYGYVMTVIPGTVFTLVGQDAADNYWVIDVPGSPSAVCWLPGQYAAVSGHVGFLYSPATPVIWVYTLSQPRNLRASCTAEYASDNNDDWWHHGGPGGDQPPPWGHGTPRADDTPWPHPTPEPDASPWPHKTPSPDETPWTQGTPWHDGNRHDAGRGGNNSGVHDGNRSLPGIGTPGNSGMPWPSPTPGTEDPPLSTGQQSSIGAQWASYTQKNHITSWTVLLKWKNTDSDQTGVRIYKDGKRIAKLGKNTSSYTDTFSGDWNDDITYRVEVFSSTVDSSSVSIDVSPRN